LNPALLTVEAQSQLLQRGELSPLDLVDATLARMRELRARSCTP
jgi:hypothetical protein